MNRDIKVAELRSAYEDFIPTQEYLDSLPDLQNSGFTSSTPIDFVGISDFRLPIRIRQRAGGTQEVTARICGQVSLDAASRGINMSRILRTFYKNKDDIFDINKLEEVLKNYQKDMHSLDAHIMMNFDYYLWQDALRSVKDDNSKEGGYQYYNITFDCNLDHTGELKKIMYVDFVYSSACPCSTALSQHAALERGIYGIPHSQRSIARIGVEFDNLIWIEDILDACRNALTTETLVFCKRADEQAFAEKNGAQPKFVEDAIRLLATELNSNPDIIDFKIICLHRESLHSHDAVATVTKGLERSVFSHHVPLEVLKDMAVHC